MLHEGGIEAFLREEVLPYAPDAWYVPGSVKIGYEISFNRHFYQPQPLRPLEEIRADILALEQETEGFAGRDSRITRPDTPLRQGASMATLNIFVSFEFDKDKDLQNNFYRQAKEETNHRIRDCSLHESYPDEAWKNKARNAIRRCDSSCRSDRPRYSQFPGVIVETDIARSLNKPIIQVRPQGRQYNGLTRLGQPIPWRWNRINTELDRIANR